MKAKKGYNKLKSNYEKIPISFFNKYVEIPGVKRILKDIKRKKILDIGCASGTHSEILHKKGAIVTGMDISKEMIDLAKSRLPTLNFKVGNMNHLPFKNNSFDILFYGLCIHYEKNLNSVFKEAHRVLKKSGRLIISTHNPYYTGYKKIKINNRTYRIMDNYFDDKKRIMELLNVKLTIYPKTISELFNPIIKNGFKLTEILEPQPIKGSRKYDKNSYNQTIKKPSFMIIEAKKI